jgi:hypothetical protein
MAKQKNQSAHDMETEATKSLSSMLAPTIQAFAKWIPSRLLKVIVARLRICKNSFVFFYQMRCMQGFRAKLIAPVLASGLGCIDHRETEQYNTTPVYACTIMCPIFCLLLSL